MVPETVTGIVIPTLGTRPDYLRLSLRSIRASGKAHVLVVGPPTRELEEFLETGEIDQFCPDPGGGPARAIDAGIRQLPENIRYVNWLGDDDLLEKGSLDLLQSVLENDPSIGLVFGRCRYIDDFGNELFVNRSGQWAVTLMKIGPDLIPQPGALFRRSLYEEVGGLRFDCGWAFDLDLFLRMAKVSTLRYKPHVVSSFRWHQGSLSVGSRDRSIAESSEVRKAHIPPRLRRYAELWERPMRLSARLIGDFASRRARRRSGSTL